MNQVDFGFLIRPSSFGLGIRSSELVAYNQRCIEALSDDFTSLWMEDHLQWDGDDNLECFSTLSYLAGQFQRFYVGSLVLCQSFRNPALLAKMAANLQFISNGRFILGLGAGWKEDELQAYGYSTPAPDVRWSQFAEALTIIQEMWKGQPTSYSGAHFHVEKAYCVPPPVPTIPILIGGGGSMRTLPLVAQYANWWNYNSCPPEEYARTLRILHEHCTQIGRDPGDIRLTYSGTVNVSRNAHEIIRDPRRYTIAGTPDEVITILEQYCSLGVHQFMVRFSNFADIECFITDVAPHFRAG